MRFLELREKEVINCKDCKRLGYVSDIEFDSEKGCLLAIIVPSGGRLFPCFGIGTEYYIRFCDIVRIGPDIVLVDLEPSELRRAHDKGKM